MVFWFRVWVIWFDKAENNGVEVVPWLVSINFFMVEIGVRRGWFMGGS
jgi:hypothetical protein